MGRNARTGALDPLDFNNLLRNMPEFNYIQTGIDVYQFDEPIDSSDMTPRHWVQLVNIVANTYHDYDGFVILHGTDTMAYTASALSFMLENLTKPVILTGSQLPIGQLRTDGKENLVTSIELASAYDAYGHPRVPEVCIYFGGRLLRGNRATKQNADNFNAFNSFNYPHLCDAGVEFTFHDHHILKPDFSRPLITHTDMNSSVVVFSLFPGIQDNVAEWVLGGSQVRGIIMRSFGSGNAPQDEKMLRLLKKAYLKDIVVVNISQCVAGSVAMSRYGTGHQLEDVGVVSGYDSTVEAAVTKMMYLQARYRSASTIRKFMATSIAGEITT